MPSKEEALLAERRQALEEEFFRRREQALLEKMRQAQQREQQRAALAEASGIKDPELLDRLIDLGIQPRTLAPLALVPLVEVAWADGSIARQEREAIVQAAHSLGLEKGSAGFALLESWLDERPDPALRRLWQEYVRALCAGLAESERRRLRENVLGRARAVAEAAGGFLGLGRKVSEAEEQVLRELDSAFAGC
ncbi:MAG: hypothetical protein KatS3mg077_0845 [Candidatus Binatia bacterium]|nr:MAG: hypothetical protein KatS3mg077_0845 [Candidatus Binatia bacterium]